jgi:hypothetical protein
VAVKWWSSHELNELWSEAALTAAVLPSWHIDQGISGVAVAVILNPQPPLSVPSERVLSRVLHDRGEGLG